MQDIKDALHRLPKVDPSDKFIKESKNRLMYQAEFQKNEVWFKAFLKRLGIILPPKTFLAQARLRLMERISIIKPSWAWLVFTKRLAASTLIMILAVTATLFFVDGHQIVSAEEATYIEILTGSATVKHADRLIWDEITNRVELDEGDLIKLDEDSEAIVHFFDDTQVRLAENSLLLISQLIVSPAYARQGIIEVHLHEGNAWVQTLNVDDGYAGLTLVTRDSIAKVINSTFDVQTNLNQPTTFSIFQNKVELQTLQPDTREIVDTLKVNENNQITITANFNSTQKPQIRVSSLSPQDIANTWVTNNLQRDQEHLIALRESELRRLRQAAGVLPGTMLYPIKQAKERLQLALSFGESSLTNAQIEIANKRLNEAIILLQEGNQQQAMEALMAYQSIARQIAAEVEGQEEDQEAVAHRLIIPHQKTLIASLPTLTINMVKEALNQTEELLVDDPVEREKIRLENSIERLYYATLFTEIGDLDAVKETLINHELVVTTILGEVESIEDSDEKKELLSSILELRNEELDLLRQIIQEQTALEDPDKELLAILNSAEEQAAKEVVNTIAFIRPLAPELVREHRERQVIDSRIQYFIEKINIYKTWRGRKNQMSRLLNEGGDQVNNITFLTELREHFNQRMRDYINTIILQLQSQARYQKHKLVQQKISDAILSKQGY